MARCTRLARSAASKGKENYVPGSEILNLQSNSTDATLRLRLRVRWNTTQIVVKKRMA